VLLTGHTGFKGSWLAIWLKHLGAVVSGLALDPGTPPSNFEASRVASLMAHDVRADIRDREALAQLVSRWQPEVIFHLAAQPLVRRGWLEPLETFDVNVRGTATVLDVVRCASRPCVVIIVTSDKCYEAATSAHSEDDRLGGHEPYGASKAAAEIVTEAYRRSYFPPELVEIHGIRVATVRAGNVIGGGDWSPDRIVPDLVRALVSGSEILVRFPKAVRPWQHVLVPLSGYLELAARLLRATEPGSLCTGWNFGPPVDGDVPVEALVEAALALWGSGSWRPVDDCLAAHEAPYLGLDIAKASQLLDWCPAWDFEESLAVTIDWYRDFYRDRSHDMLSRCLDDVERYMAASPSGLLVQEASR
jgi:CDP-glucose 4,6-dehydratase